MQAHGQSKTLPCRTNQNFLTLSQPKELRDAIAKVSTALSLCALNVRQARNILWVRCIKRGGVEPQFMGFLLASIKPKIPNVGIVSFSFEVGYEAFRVTKF